MITLRQFERDRRFEDILFLIITILVLTFFYLTWLIATKDRNKPPPEPAPGYLKDRHGVLRHYDPTVPPLTAPHEQSDGL